MDYKILKRSWFSLILLTASHLVVDAYGNFFPSLLPIFVVKFHLSMAAVGAMASVTSITSSLIQPTFGYLSDRLSGKVFVIVGILASAIFMSTLGFASSYGLLLLLLVLGGLGVSSFHPQAAGLTGQLPERKKGFGMSVFLTGGSVGYATGPLIAVFVASRAGIDHLYATALPGILIALLVIQYLPNQNLSQGKQANLSLSSEFLTNVRSISLLEVIVVIRAIVNTSFTTFLPLFLKNKGLSLEAMGAMISLYILAGAVGGIIGGYVADKIGRKSILLFSLIFPIPFLMFFTFAGNVLIPILLLLSGFIFLSSVPVTVIMAQELMPNNTSTVSALMMGFGWGLGGLMAFPFGVLADLTGITVALRVVILLPLIGVACVIGLPKMTPVPVRRFKG